MSAYEELEAIAAADQELAQRAAEGADAAAVEIQVGSDQEHHLRYGGGEVILDHSVRSRSVTVRAVVDGYLGVASTESSDRESLRRVRAQAIAAAEAQARLGGRPDSPYSLPRPEQAMSTSHGNPDLVDWGQNGGKVRTVHGVLARARAQDVLMAGSVRTGMSSQTLLAANGHLLSQRHAVGNGQFIAQTETGSGFRCGQFTDAGQVGLDRIAEDAIFKAKAASKKLDLPVGHYDVVLEPPAVAEILDWMGYVSFTAKSVEDGISCLAGREGEPITGPNITIYDDATAPTGLGLASSFDGEGVAHQRVTFIDSGKAGQIAHSMASAARFGGGTCSTGHGDGSGGESISHIHMLGGDQDLESLVAGMDRGLWINRFHYVNGLLDPRQATMTGLTRDGCLLVEKGEVLGGFHTMRFTESILEAFKRVDGLSEQLSAISRSMRDSSATVVPALRIRDFHFTSKQTQ